MLATLRRALLVGAVLACAYAPAFAVDYGRTQGAFDVSGGSAIYTIPIWTPPGPNGVQPSIALTYSSASGNGVGGVGWHLAAASSIERCNRTKAQDGEAAAVDLTNSDRFCIGGNRMRLISGTYGASGSVYYTEIADYSRITASGTAGNGPAQFTVEAKSGLIYEYGSVTNARVFPGVSPNIATTVQRWMLNKVRDRNGNNYLISYNNLNGFAVPDVISWTPTSLGAITYQYEAKFNYSNARTDKDSYIGKVAGFDVVNRYRIENIQIKSAGTVVRKYRFGYETAAVTDRSRMNSAKECADDAESNCFLPLSFTYQNGQAGVTAGTGTPPATSSTNTVIGRYDFNGDGKDDILYTNGTCYATLGTNTGFTSGYSTGLSMCSTATVVDRFLPNGRDAIATLNGSGQLLITYWDDASSGFVSANTGITTTIGFSADYDGDGLADLSTSNGGSSVAMRRNTSSGSGTISFSSSTTTTASLSAYGAGANYAYIRNYFGKGLRKADINGDGRQDVFGVILIPIFNGQGQQTGVSNYTTVLLGTTNGFWLPPQPWIGGAIDWPSINFNGDACTDRVGGSTVYISACNGVAASTTTVPAAPLQVLDWDADGKTDFLVNNGGNFGVYLSTGVGFSSPLATSVPSAGTFFAADVDGDHLEDLIKINTSGAFSYWTHTLAGYVPTTFATNVPDLLSGVTDGFGVAYSPNYVSTGWGGSYATGAATAFPLQESDARIVVAQVTTSNGIGGTYNKTYYYVGARDNLERDDFAGFQRIDETDSRNSLISRTYAEQVFPVAGMVSQQELMQPNGTTPISRTVFTNTFATLDATANNQRFFIYPSGATSTEYEVSGLYNGALVRTVTAANVYESASGTLYDRTVTTTEPASGANGVTAGGTWTARTYTPTTELLNDTTNWCIGRPKQVQQINSHGQTYGSSTTRTTNATWNAAMCRPTQTVAEPGSTTLQVTTDIGYDSFGNSNSSTVTGVGMAARTSSAIYSNATYTTGQFPLSVTNAEGHVTTSTWNYDLGVPSSMTDPNSLTTSWLYDPYGRRIRETRPDTTYTTWDFTSCTGCDLRGKIVVDQNQRLSGGTMFHRSTAVLDQFERSVFEYSLRPDNNYDITTRNFDALGRVANEYFPYSSPASAGAYTTNTYDVLNRITAMARPISEVNPTLQTTNVYYEGLTTRVVDPQSKQSSKVANAGGQLVRSVDHDGYYQIFEYDAFGSPKRVMDQLGNTLQSSVYNVRGMLTQRTDMEMGTWDFIPDALGQTVSQTDAKGQITTFQFDKLGRVKQRAENEGSTDFAWSAVVGRIGGLEYACGPGYCESYSYDSLARVSETVFYADGDGIHYANYVYNNMGALDTVTYPTSTSSYRLKLQYEYQNGTLYRIKDFNAPTTVFWTANAFNARGQITQETLGNGLVTNRSFDTVTGWLKSIQTGASGGTAIQNLAYEWDLVGNLKKRKDINQSNLTEEFFYDNLYRLDYSQLNASTNLDMGYDALGNISSKSDVGTYTYHATKKHQVTSTSNGWSFTYDANGNMETGAGRTNTWTSYNYLASTVNGSNTAAFSYGFNRQYWKQVANYASGGAATTIYLGGLVEKVTTSAGTDWRHMIRAGGATIIVSRQSNGTNTVSYVTTDHLGSSSAITNGSGSVLVNSSFDAFGKRRGSNWAGSPSSADWAAIASTTRRGYTGHSMLDNLALIHMNGRTQDPILGRFLSMDPFITNALNTQNYNRYSYVYNRPLALMDPSGFCEEGEEEVTQLDGDTAVVCRAIITVSGTRRDEIPFGSIDISGIDDFFHEDLSSLATNGGVLRLVPASDPSRGEPRDPEKKSRIAKCASDQFGLSDFVALGAIVAGQPIPGTKPFVTPGSSRGTSLAGMVADEVFGEAKFPIRVPTIVGGPGTGKAFAIAGTRSVARFASRAVPFLGWAMLAYDGIKIGFCTFSDDEE